MFELLWGIKKVLFQTLINWRYGIDTLQCTTTWLSSSQRVFISFLRMGSISTFSGFITIVSISLLLKFIGIMFTVHLYERVVKGL